MDSENKFIVLDYLYNFNLPLVKEYSLSIYESLNIGWQNFVCCKDKKSSIKYKDKLEKHLDKLSKKEKVDISFIKDTKEKIEYLQSNGLLNNKFKGVLLSGIKKVSCLTEYFRFLLNKYDEIIEIDNKKNNKDKESLELPTKITVKDYCVVDKDGYYNYHVKKVNGTMVVVESSIKAEKQLYQNALSENREIFKENNKNIKLSPFEKKRRIYIENIFNLNKLLKQLKEKKVDITYPLEKYFIYSKKINDGLYHEISKKVSKENIFDYIMCLTIENFNYANMVNEYGKCVRNFNNIYNKLDDIIKEEFQSESIRYKNNLKYKEFTNSEGLVPSIYDIYNAVNKRLIDSIHVCYEDIPQNMSEYISRCTRYMNEEDIINFYEVYKTVLNINKNNIECFKMLQKGIVSVIKKKSHLDEDIILNEYLKEQKIY